MWWPPPVQARTPHRTLTLSPPSIVKCDNSTFRVAGEIEEIEGRRRWHLRIVRRAAAPRDFHARLDPDRATDQKRPAGQPHRIAGGRSLDRALHAAVSSLPSFGTAPKPVTSRLVAARLRHEAGVSPRADRSPQSWAEISNTLC